MAIIINSDTLVWVPPHAREQSAGSYLHFQKLLSVRLDWRENRVLDPMFRSQDFKLFIGPFGKL